MAKQSVGLQLVFPCVLACLLILCGCGGSKLLKEPEPLTITEPLATASDQRLTATLDWVIFRDGPGAWARDVDWDEYLMRVQNLSDEPIRVTKIVVFDSFGTPIELGGNRRQLIEGSKETTRRYKDKGLKINAGPGALVVAGYVTAGTAAVALGTASATVLGTGAASSAMIGASAAAIILFPVLLADSAVRGMNNKEVDDQIESRQTLLPAVLPEAQEQSLDLFYPLAPSPRQIEITYVDSHGEHTLIIDTQIALDGLHLVPADK